jgi:hypothetical protein
VFSKIVQVRQAALRAVIAGARDAPVAPGQTLAVPYVLRSDRFVLG